MNLLQLLALLGIAGGIGYIATKKHDKVSETKAKRRKYYRDYYQKKKIQQRLKSTRREYKTTKNKTYRKSSSSPTKYVMIAK